MSEVELLDTVKFIQPNRGKYYGEVLRDLHNWLLPRNYVEVGVNQGSTIRLANCDTIGIDPKFLIDANVIGKKPSCHFFQTTSDDFFANFDPKSLFAAPVHLAFLDGLHEYECLLRDFMNIEKSMDQNSMVVMHDCIPTDVYMARRKQHDLEIRKLTPTPASWTGDVWKTVLILKRYRPDLAIIAFDSAPTGLIFVGKLDSTSGILQRVYGDCVEEMRSVTLEEYGIERYTKGLEIRETVELDTPSKMREVFSWF